MTSNFLIIGGNSDIASVLIEYLLQQDAQLTVLVRQDGDSSIHSSSVNMIVGDATQEDDLQKAIDKALENGKIDGIVHCVGSIVIRPPHAMKKDAFEEVILTNLTSAFLTLSLRCAWCKKKYFFLAGAAYCPAKANRVNIQEKMFAPCKIIKHGPERDQGGLSPTNSDLVNTLGMTDFHFDWLHYG